MRLYTTPGGQWAGTEKAWKDALKAEGIVPKDYTGRGQVNVPTDKPGLLEFLTFYSVNVIAPQMQPAGDAATGAVPGPLPHRWRHLSTSRRCGHCTTPRQQHLLCRRLSRTPRAR